LSPNGARARLSRDTERCQAFTTWLDTYNHHGHTGLGGQPPLPVWLTSQVRTSGRGYPTGVALLLLSPSASPERVWLYAAELDERLLAPHILTSTRCIRDSMRISLIRREPGIRRTTNSGFTQPVHVGLSTT